ncbi:LysR family transcriptional regulator [Pseudonocardia spinosispora]|uniref:LysR family transcriptional regulator n=1 Tax=Pseudonocardia spinosispora TaxID=103441 RepID=UPI000400AC0D|nr:LysR family transcriptional regulator [Pseudonocardia spinosispora]
MELRHLSAISAIARKGSVSAAAASLGCTQSAVSQQIKAFENELGVALLTRRGGARPVRLTDIGARVAVHAAAILTRVALVENEVARHTSGTSTVLRVGTLGSTALHLLPQTLRLLRKRSTVKVELAEEHGDTPLLASVERGQLDVTFAHLPLPRGPFEWRHLLTVQQVLIVGRGQLDENVPPEDVLREACRLPFISFKQVRPPYDAIRQLRALGYSPQVVMRTDDNRTLQNLVGIGLGVAVVPETAVDPHDDAIRVVQNIPDLPPCPFGVAWHSEMSVPGEFIDCALVAARSAAAKLKTRLSAP